MEVAVKCISKKNLAKSQSLLDKEIGILKVFILDSSTYVSNLSLHPLTQASVSLQELQHDNIVRLLDCQVNMQTT